MNNLTEFCTTWLNAWTGNQPGQLILFYTEDAYYSDPANRQGLKGHKQLLPYFSKLLRYNPDWKWKALEIIETAAGFTLKWDLLLSTIKKKILKAPFSCISPKILQENNSFGRVHCTFWNGPKR